MNGTQVTLVIVSLIGLYIEVTSVLMGWIGYILKAIVEDLSYMFVNFVDD